MPNPVISGATLTAGLRADFADVYNKTYEGVKSRLGDVMEMDIPSDKLTEIYGYYESAPYPIRWPRGEGISSKNFKSRQFSVTNKDWGRRVEWHENDRQDDQTKSLFDRVRDLGEHFATLTERIFFQILTASADSSLLDAIPNAADGAALHAATDGDGGNRFGVSGGNIISGSGVTSSQAIRNNFFSAIQRMRQFQDTESQPLWGDSQIDKGFVVFFNVANWQVFAEAFLQGRTVQVVQNVAAAENVAAGTPTNIIMDSGISVTLVPTQRITDNDWFVFMRGARRKAIFRQVRMPVREAFATMDTSDRVRDTKVEYIQWDSREGYGLLLPYQTVKVNN